MDTYIFSSLLLCGMARLVVSYGASWSMTSVTLERGQVLELVCTATDTMTYDVMRITKTTEGDGEMRLADSDGPSDIFRTLYRFEFAYQLLGSIAKLTLRYKGIEPEDGGLYRCFKLYVPEFPDAFVTVQVDVPLSDLYIASNDTQGERRYPDGEVLDLTDSASLQCRATINRSGKPPKMWIHLGTEDISDRFVSSAKNDSISMYGRLTYWTSETSMVYDKARAYHPYYNKQKLVCSAQAQGYDKVNTSVLLNYIYSPLVQCEHSVYMVRLGESLSVICNVSMNPVGLITFIGWMPGMLKQTQAIDSVGLQRATLYSASVTEVMYGNYTLVATNSLGTQRKPFIISPKTAASEDLTSRSDRPQISRMTSGVTFLLLLLPSRWLCEQR